MADNSCYSLPHTVPMKTSFVFKPYTISFSNLPQRTDAWNSKLFAFFLFFPSVGRANLPGLVLLGRAWSWNLLYRIYKKRAS